jgi:hypothetical protein
MGCLSKGHHGWSLQGSGHAKYRWKAGERLCICTVGIERDGVTITGANLAFSIQRLIFHERGAAEGIASGLYRNSQQIQRQTAASPRALPLIRHPITLSG